MTWDGLAVGARWPKCGHPRTPENTQHSPRQAARCKECHRQLARDWWERRRNEGTVALEAAPDPRADELGGEFVKARQRWAVGQRKIARMAA